MADEKDAPGLVAAIRATMQDSLISQTEQQLSLLPSPAAAMMEPSGEATDAEIAAGGARGRGRPPGAKNKSTTDWTKYILGRYRSPMEFLAEAYNRPVQALAAELKCNVLDALKVQMICAKELLPYLHQKQTTASDDGGKEPVPLAIMVSEQGAALVDAGARGDGMRVIAAEILPPDNDELGKGKDDDKSNT